MFKQLLLAALSVVSVSAPALSQVYTPSIGMRAAGINIVVSDKCPEGAGGYYQPSEMKMVFCTTSPFSFKTVLYHESIHALQHILDNDPSNMHTLKPLAEDYCTPMTPSEYQMWSSYDVDEETKVVEWVAWTCQNDYKVVDQLWEYYLNEYHS